MPELSPLTPSDPEVLGGYRLAGRLGEGGQGAVYLAHGERGEAVAVKLLHSRLGADATARARFAREADIVRRVAPFCTARVLAADVDGRIPYLVSEYIDGPSLLDFVHRNGPLDDAALRRLAVGTLTALAAVHEAGIVHRDFKPGNVLLSADGPRVVDFGIARALDVTSSLTSQVIGTPAYMAPEQFGGGPVSPAIDLFAWGSTMAYAATGRPPFGAGTVPAIIAGILEGEPRLDGLRPPLREMVTACLAKNSANRPTARDLLSRLLTTPDAHAPVALADAARAAVPGAAGLWSTAPARPVRPEPTRPAGPGATRLGPLIGGAAVVALLGVAATWFYLDGPGHATTGGNPTATASTSRTHGDAALVTTVPDACTVPGAALPHRAAGLTPEHPRSDADDQECTWKLYRSDQAMELDLEMTAQSTLQGARDTLARDRAYYGNAQDNGGFYEKPESVSGLGDEAVAVRATGQVDLGKAGQLTKSYFTGGAEVETRFRNVIIKISWNGADYPVSVRKSYSLKGTDFPYEQARQEAVALVRQALTHLS